MNIFPTVYILGNFLIPADPSKTFPLTFIAGIYGVNFNPEASPFNMPELGWQWGYPMVWIVMIAVAITMLIYFKRKKWL